ncbi:MAG: PEP-CTERM sorting domain-containing protein [Pirellulaceae bacterium]|nr:PEP-CTERM sorting domain-containing protein [Planctomycetales bacterium]
MKTHIMLVGSLVTAAVLQIGSVGNCQIVFEDDFNDGDAETPVKWTPRELPSVEYDVSSGDYIFRALDGFDTSGDAMASDPADFVLEDTSAVSQVRGVAPFSSMGIGARWNEADATGYWNAILPDGGFYIGRGDGADYVILAAGNVPFDVTTTDVLLRFDAIGTTIKTWAWLPGEPMPEEPTLTAVDATYQSGTPAIYAVAPPGGAAIYRFVNVSVPEPSTMLMAVFGALCVFARGRQK